MRIRLKFTRFSRTLFRLGLVFVFLYIAINGYITRTTPNQKYGAIFYDAGMQCENCSLARRLKYFEKALFHNPGLSRAYYHAGEIYEALGDDENALKYYLQGAKLDHAPWEASYQAGVLLYKKGQWDEAIPHLKQAKQFSSNASHVNFYLGYVFESKKMYKEAIQYYREIDCHNFQKCEESFAREAVLRYLVVDRKSAESRIADLREMKEDELADAIERFMETKEMPDFMKKRPEHIVNSSE